MKAVKRPLGKPLPPLLREMDILKLITDYCDAHGIFWRRRNIGGATKKGGHWITLNRKGEADLWGITRGGRHWECEVKRPGEEPTVAQFTWLNLCRSYGAVAFWVDSLEQFMEYMKAEDDGWARH